MYYTIKCIVQGKQARVKNADLRHPSCTVVMQKRKSASPVLNVLRRPKVHRRIYNSSSLASILRQLNPAQALPSFL